MHEGGGFLPLKRGLECREIKGSLDVRRVDEQLVNRQPVTVNPTALTTRGVNLLLAGRDADDVGVRDARASRGTGHSVIVFQPDNALEVDRTGLSRPLEQDENIVGLDRSSLCHCFREHFLHGNTLPFALIGRLRN